MQSVLLIPHYAFTISMLEKRKPLSADAERAGWVGCNFLLDHIPADARIPVVQDGNVISSAIVREAYAKLRPLEQLDTEKRGWTLDVLNVVHALRKTEFSLAEVYAYEKDLACLHPKNAHVRAKIRQQLQILRKLDLVTFLDRGLYRLKPE